MASINFEKLPHCILSLSHKSRYSVGPSPVGHRLLLCHRLLNLLCFLNIKLHSHLFTSKYPGTGNMHFIKSFYREISMGKIILLIGWCVIDADYHILTLSSTRQNLIASPIVRRPTQILSAWVIGIYQSFISQGCLPYMLLIARSAFSVV